MAGSVPPQLLPAFEPYGMPVIGIGTYELRGDDCVRAVQTALRVGFRLIDTAAAYSNEELVGEGIRASGVSRSDIFVIVKLAMKSMGNEEKARSGILESIKKLGIGYADCVLIHWPGCRGLKLGDRAGQLAARQSCWRAMRALYSEGAVRHLGVSNFHPRHFTGLDIGVASPSGSTVPDEMAMEEEEQGVRPLVNQIELHPLCVQAEVVNYCRGRGMILQQYSPLGKGNPRLLQHAALLALQQQAFQDFSVAEMLVMWGLSQGFCVLVRSQTEAHLRANWEAALRYYRRPSTENHKNSTPAPLTAEQRDMLTRLREIMNVAEDTHLCWCSSDVA